MRYTRTPDSVWSHFHVHSTFSAGDALSSVAELVARAAENDQPCLGLTDHGNMSGAVALYTECTKVGIAPFPGSEMYLVRDRADKKAKRYHLGVLATTSEGYRNLVALSTRSHQQFFHKPLIDLSDLAECYEAGGLRGLVALSGCYSGLPIQDLLNYGPEAARATLALYDKWFDACYVEMMNHGITWDDGVTDGDLCDALYDLAQQSGLPVLVTGDVHYATGDQRALHDSLKRLVSYGSGDDDGVFRGDGYSLVPTAGIRALHCPTHWAAGLSGQQNLQSRWDLTMPHLDKYQYRIPQIVADPMFALRQRVSRGAVANPAVRFKYPGSESTLLDEELDVIEKTGMAGYLLLVAEVTNYLREQGIVFQARGSASGSLVCYRLGITSLDPIKWKLRYERFITTDRTKPPDVDLDVEWTRRHEVVNWLRSRFAVHQIGTFLELAMGAEEGKGSLVVKYMAKARARGETPSWNEVPPEDKGMLAALSRTGAYSGYGVHAAGLVVTTNDHEFDDLVPQMYVASSKTMVSQYDMGDIERLGLVKLDLLGLRALSTIRGCLETLDRDPAEGLDWIPLNDSRTFTAVRRGDTVGVFQFDGFTNRRGAGELRVANLPDIIAVMALYRPAVMSSGGTNEYLARRFGAHRVPQLHPILARALKDTHGLVVFQEQVIEILRALGMSPADLTALLKAVKASNNNVVAAAQVIASYGADVHRLCRLADVPTDQAEMLWRAIEGFAEYGFNRAHATRYGLTAYQTAFLKVNYPIAYFGALLASFAGVKDKEQVYLNAARQHGIRVKSPLVGVSGTNYTVDPSGRFIRRGLKSIKGIGDKAAEHLASHGPYENLEDLIGKCGTRPVTGGQQWLKSRDPSDLCGTLGTLYEAGALDGLVLTEVSA